MSDFLGGPLSLLDGDSIRAAIAAAYAESSQLEFKESLPAKDTPDPWLTHPRKLGNRARDSLLSEIVAFSNSHGGLLLVGVEESAGDPSRASGLRPIPDVADLAERISQQIRDCVDPPLLAVECRGIPTEADGSGVLAVRVSSSANAPHRLTTTKECTQRRGSRSETMDMRSIQDLSVLHLATNARIDSQFVSQLDLAVKRANTFVNSVQRYNLETIRVTCVPVNSDILLAEVFRNADVSPVYLAHEVLSGTRGFSLALPLYSMSERPIVRGSRHSCAGTDFCLNIEVFASGLVEFELLNLSAQSSDDFLYPEWVLGLFANALLTVDRVRSAARAPNAEYAIEVTVARMNGALRLTRFGAHHSLAGEIEPNPLVLPRLSYKNGQELDQLLSITSRDLFHAAGVAYDLAPIHLKL